MLDLPSVALCCVDTRTPRLALKAMQTCLKDIRFGDAVLFTASDENLVQFAADGGIRIVDIGEISSIDAYSNFILRGLSAHIHNDFMLVVQWDGFVMHPDAWTDDFLNYDYIGAVWPEGFSRFKVGNGGFSLRSRKLLDALNSSDIRVTHPEDLCICDVNREVLENKHGIRFAPPAVAARFAYEHLRTERPTFGFHGTFNLIDALAPADMLDVIKSMPREMFFAAGMRTLAKRLITNGQYESAKCILMGRLRSGDRRWRIVSLLLRLMMRKFVGMPPDKLRR